MPRIISNGKCYTCGKALAKRAMTQHLTKCHSVSEPRLAGKGHPAYHILVEGYRASQYWLHLAVPADATLEELDGFLRAIWLECCDHLSGFTAGREETDMTTPVGAVLAPGMALEYTYDFGSSTELELRGISAAAVADPDGDIVILARNDPPDNACDVCGKPAVAVCSQCVWTGDGWLCAKCAEKHECGEEMLLPVVNSPRVGVCGYTGPVDEKRFAPAKGSR
jgi:hypothetical protein